MLNSSELGDDSGDSSAGEMTPETDSQDDLRDKSNDGDLTAIAAGHEIRQTLGHMPPGRDVVEQLTAAGEVLALSRSCRRWKNGDPGRWRTGLVRCR